MIEIYFFLVTVSKVFGGVCSSEVDSEEVRRERWVKVNASDVNVESVENFVGDVSLAKTEDESLNKNEVSERNSKTSSKVNIFKIPRLNSTEIREASVFNMREAMQKANYQNSYVDEFDAKLEQTLKSENMDSETSLKSENNSRTNNKLKSSSEVSVARSTRI